MPDDLPLPDEDELPEPELPDAAAVGIVIVSGMARAPVPVNFVLSIPVMTAVPLAPMEYTKPLSVIPSPSVSVAAVPEALDAAANASAPNTPEKITNAVHTASIIPKIFFCMIFNLIDNILIMPAR